MLQLTIQEVIESAEQTQGHCIYVYRDGETVFYIGRSAHPCEQLREHLGQGVYTPYPDAIGSLILENFPQSLLWTIEIWTLQELRPDLFQMARESDGVADLASSLESYLISQIKPCLNSIGRNYSNPLPERYVKRKVANAGVKLGEKGDGDGRKEPD